MTPAPPLSTLIIFSWDDLAGRGAELVPRGATFSPSSPSSDLHGVPGPRPPDPRSGAGPRHRRVHGAAGPCDPADPGRGERAPRRPDGDREDGSRLPADPPTPPSRETGADERLVHHAPSRPEPRHVAPHDVLRGTAGRAGRRPAWGHDSAGTGGNDPPSAGRAHHDAGDVPDPLHRTSPAGAPEIGPVGRDR